MFSWYLPGLELWHWLDIKPPNLTIANHTVNNFLIFECTNKLLAPHQKWSARSSQKPNILNMGTILHFVLVWITNSMEYSLLAWIVFHVRWCSTFSFPTFLGTPRGRLASFISCYSTLWPGTWCLKLCIKGWIYWIVRSICCESLPWFEQLLLFFYKIFFCYTAIAIWFVEIQYRAYFSHFSAFKTNV